MQPKDLLLARIKKKIITSIQLDKADGTVYADADARRSCGVRIHTFPVLSNSTKVRPIGTFQSIGGAARWEKQREDNIKRPVVSPKTH